MHCADLVLETGADPQAPGGAVTIALCGSWDHQGACRWPHHTHATWSGNEGDVRIVFVSEPADEVVIRKLIDAGLLGGCCTGPDGIVSRWTWRGSRVGELSPDERDQAEKMMRCDE